MCVSIGYPLRRLSLPRQSVSRLFDQLNMTLILVLLSPDMLCLWNTVDPIQSEEADWSGSAGLSFRMLVYIKSMDQAILLADN